MSLSKGPMGMRGPQGSPRKVIGEVVSVAGGATTFDLKHRNVVLGSLVGYAAGTAVVVQLLHGTGTNGVDQIVLAANPGAVEVTADYRYIPGR